MLGKNAQKLIQIGSSAISKAKPEQVKFNNSVLVDSLSELLTLKNGFYAFESALHVFPAGAVSTDYSLSEWNDPKLWRSEYGDMAKDLLFFAEDAFGGQFALGGRIVVRFDPETGERTEFAKSVEEWARLILEEYEVETGFPLAHEWQAANGPLPPKKRLVPKVPFVVGGEFDVSNLYALDSVKGMRARGDLARQLRDLPDGTPIKFDITG